MKERKARNIRDMADAFRSRPGRRSRHARAGRIAVLAAAWIASGAAMAADEPGSADHPLIGRYEGATIVYYRTSDFDEAALLAAPHDFTAILDRDATHDRSGSEWLGLEGRVTEIRYEIPSGRSSLEVIRNYESTLAAGGFETLFRCNDHACLDGRLRDPYLVGQQIDTTNGISTAYFDHARYVLARRGAGPDAIHAAVLTGEYRGIVTAFLQVVETKPMEAGRVVFISATDMKSSFDRSGSVDLYGILFDTDQASLKPESKPTLEEIFRLLSENPDLKLEIVGHTDDVGSAEYNLDLSNRRAASVVTALTHDHAIAPERLTASGAGLTAPVASNTTEDGRAQNRRVELRAK